MIVQTRYLWPWGKSRNNNLANQYLQGKHSGPNSGKPQTLQFMAWLSGPASPQLLRR